MKKLLAVGAAAGLSFVMSGCFVMQTLNYTDNKPKAGKKTTAKITVLGETDSDMRSGSALRGDLVEYPFFLVLAEGAVAKKGVFDAKGVFDGPVDLVINDDLIDPALSECDVPVPRRGLTPRVVATEDPFVATTERKYMLAEVPLKTDETAIGVVVSFNMGTWIDDGDGVPEDPGATDDEFECQPAYTSFFATKGAEDPMP